MMDTANESLGPWSSILPTLQETRFSDTGLLSFLFICFIIVTRTSKTKT